MWSAGHTIRRVMKIDLREVLTGLEGKGHDYLIADFNSLASKKVRVEEGLKKGAYQILINNTGGLPQGLLLRQVSNSLKRLYQYTYT